MRRIEGFFRGFEKAAADESTQPSSFGWKKAILPATGAVAAGIGTYALSRRGGKKLVLPKAYTKKLDPLAIRQGVSKEPSTTLGRFTGRLMEGADEIVPVRVDSKKAITPRKINKDEVAFVSDPFVGQAVSGRNIVGDVPKNRSFISNTEDKWEEARKLQSVLPGGAGNLFPVTNIARGTGKSGLKSRHEKWVKEHGDYLYKHRGSVQSGPGGESFVSSKDVDSFLSGGKLTKEKETAIRGILRKPEDYIIQKKHELKRSKITGKPIEYRVHIVDGKVLDPVPRTAFVPTSGGSNKAKQVAEEFARSLGKTKSKGEGFALDVAATKDGFKIMETNPGGASGFLSPSFMATKDPISLLTAVSQTQKRYKALTGRSSQLEAGIKGIGAGAVGGGGLMAAQEILGSKPSTTT